MKRIIICCLIFTGMATALFAQTDIRYEAPLNISEATYNFPKPGMGKAHFSFWVLNKTGGGQLIIDLNSIKHLKYLPNLDSLVNSIKPTLQLLADSFKTDGFNRRIDYLSSTKYPQIRIANYNKDPQQFVVKEGYLNELKTKMDTIRIKAYVEVAKEDIPQSPLTFNNRYTGSNKPEMQPYFITLILNNCSDLFLLPENSLQNCVARLKQELGPDYVSNANPSSNYSAYFNMNTNKMFSPSSLKWIKNPGSVQELVPNIYVGFQYAIGNFIPSFSIGARYTFADRRHSTKRIYAMWEPHFIFSKDVLNNTITDRNDFVTLRYIAIENRRKEPFDFVGNFSLGYLVSRKGNWFEPNTFKIGIPGVRSGWLQLEPEFFFHDFLKGISPSIKLTLHYE
jgi:hypothetical protein